MTDKIINFYDKLGLIKNSNLPKSWKKHHIYNNSMILCLGGTGSGKSNALVNYIARSSGEFYKIIVCSFSTTFYKAPGFARGDELVAVAGAASW
jgi:hypothetical protein